MDRPLSRVTAMKRALQRANAQLEVEVESAIAAVCEVDAWVAAQIVLVDRDCERERQRWYRSEGIKANPPAATSSAAETTKSKQSEAAATEVPMGLERRHEADDARGRRLGGARQDSGARRVQT